MDSWSVAWIPGNLQGFPEIYKDSWRFTRIPRDLHRFLDIFRVIEILPRSLVLGLELCKEHPDIERHQQVYELENTIFFINCPCSTFSQTPPEVMCASWTLACL